MGKPVAKNKAKKLQVVEPASPLHDHGWMAVGLDTSMSSIAGAAIAYDKITDTWRGPAFAITRWSKDAHYFYRLREAAKAHNIILDLQSQLGVLMRTDEIFIAQEEPFPPHTKFTGKGQGQSLKQQEEVSGAVLGGLLRYGYDQISQIHNVWWRTVIAEALTAATSERVTTHYSKWPSGELAQRFNTTPKHSGKFRAKQWALDVMTPFFAEHFRPPNEIPDWPDIIESKDGKTPRPDHSRAKAIQPDDRYDALAMMMWQWAELRTAGIDSFAWAA